MQKTILYLSLILYLCCGLPVYADLGGFAINFYTSSVSIDPSGYTQHSEDIDVMFYEPRQGIFREIPLYYDEDGITYQNIVNNASVANHTYTFAVQDTNSEIPYVYMRIGTAGVYNTGLVLYQISYDGYGFVRQYDGYQMLSIDMIGHARSTSIINGVGRIEFANSGYIDAIESIAIYYGFMGSQTQLSGYDIDDATISIPLPTSGLSAYQGLTVRIQFADGTFVLDDLLQKDLIVGPTSEYVVDNLLQYIPITQRSFWHILLLCIYGSIVGFSIGRVKRREHRIGRQKTILASYVDIPDGLSPSEVGVLVDDIVDAHDITAMIYQWAAEGYIKIRQEKTKTWFFPTTITTLIKQKDIAQDAPAFAIDFFTKLFALSDEYRLEAGMKFRNTVDSTMTALASYVTKKGRFRSGSRLYGSYFRTANRAILIGGSIVLFVVALFTLIIMTNEFMIFPIQLLWFVGICGFILFLKFWYLLPEEVMTLKGKDLREKVLGFKEFLMKVEKIKLEQFLAQDPLYFDKILPYAVVLGVETSFLKKITPLMKDTPSWYDGSGDINAFALGLTHSVRALNTAATYSPPNSSSSGRSSGSSGGFSGGGGGGGGGGSR